MADFFYPLPLKQLKSRFAPLFDVIKSRQSASFIGLPDSAKSGYLKFILENETLLDEFLGERREQIRVLYFEPVPFETQNQYHWLFQLSIKLESIDKRYKHPETDDAVIIMTAIQKYLLQLEENKEHLCIILAHPFVWENLKKQSSYVLKAIWDTKRQPPRNPCSLVFLLHSKSPSNETFEEFYDRLLIAMNETILYFPVLSKEESIYTIDRFASFNNVTLSRKQKELLYELTGGYYPLITSAIKIVGSCKLKITSGLIRSLVSNEIIVKEIEKLWKSLTNHQKSELKRIIKGIKATNFKNSTLSKLGIISKEGKISSTWIKSFVLHKRYRTFEENLRIPAKRFLKGKEYLVFSYMISQREEVVSRDEIADILWGKQVDEKYSNWAIDKTISRIRKKLKLKHSKFTIVTVKNKGYVVIG